MNYKQKALDHVRSVCPELIETVTTQNYDEIDWLYHTPHLEHWLNSIAGQNIETDCAVSRLGSMTSIKPKGHDTLVYDNTKDGENQDSSFYEAYCSIVGIS